MSTEDTIAITELAAISIDNRFSRLVDAAETNAENGERIAIALETLVGLFGCAIEIVRPEEANGVTRASIRTHKATPIHLQGREANDAKEQDS